MCPTYTFENIDTGEQYELEMRMSEREEYLQSNPNVRQVLIAMNLIDPLVAGRQKPPSDFQKHVLGRIKEAHPHGHVGDRKFNIPKEI